MPEANLVKILFRFYSNVLDAETVETVWGEVFDKEYGYYKINNIPFYIPEIASDDIVWAEYSDTEGMLIYRKTIQFSGNSTIHAIIMDDAHSVTDICRIFEEFGCNWEGMNDKYFAIEIPANVDYIPVKRKLDELQKDEIIGYAESCLSEKHQYKNISF